MFVLELLFKYKPKASMCMLRLLSKQIPPLLLLSGILLPFGSFVCADSPPANLAPGKPVAGGANAKLLSAQLTKEGGNLSNAGRYAAALKKLEKARSLDPENAQAWLFSGITCLKMGRYKDSAKMLEQVLKIDPKNAYAYSTGGSIKADIGDYDGALVAYNRAIELNPEIGSFYNNRAAVFIAQNNLHDALSDLRFAKQYDPLNQRTVVQIVAVLINLKRYVEALNIIKASLLPFPENASLYAYRGIVKSVENDRVSAEKDFRRALELNPGDLTTKECLEMLNEGKTPPATIIIQEKKISADYLAARHWEHIASSKMEKKDFAGALESVEKALSTDANNDDLILMKGLILFSSGRNSEALSAVNQAIALESEQPDYYLLRAAIKGEAGDVAGAKADVRKYLESNPDNEKVKAFLKELDEYEASQNKEKSVKAAAPAEK